MSKWSKLLEEILLGKRDKNIPFEDLRGLLHRLGFDERVKGSHHLFRKSGIYERPNLQRDGKHAKPYQVRQIRNILLAYKLRVEADG